MLKVRGSFRYPCCLKFSYKDANSVRFTSNYRDITEVVKDSLRRWERELLCSQAGQWSVGSAHSVLCYYCLLTECGLRRLRNDGSSPVAENRFVCLQSLAPSVSLTHNYHVIT
jgi:hypothetical protein